MPRYIDEEIASSYACAHHPVLDVDTWHQVEAARVTDEGLNAVLVCQFVCKVRDKCPVTHGVETIAGAGWYDRSGGLIPIPAGTLETRQAAAYIGISAGAFRYLMERRRIKPVTRYRSLAFYSVPVIQELAQRYGPEHGTMARAKLHQILGQECRYCERALAEEAVATA